MRILTADICGRSVQAILAGHDLWFSQKALATLYDTTTQNINIHISDMQAAGMLITAHDFEVPQREGSRSVRRRIKHYDVEIAHAIGIRSQRFVELNEIISLAEENEVHRTSYRIAPVKERRFSELLQGLLAGITPVETQYRIGRYQVDFYLPEHFLVVEYDEKQHSRPRHQSEDQRRQRQIEETLGARFIRVRSGEEIRGLNIILRSILLPGQAMDSDE